MFKRYRVESKARFTLFIIITLLIIIGIVTMFLKPTYVSGSTEARFDTIKVKHGDTLWNIAAIYADEHTDMRAFIYDISQLNGITGSEIIPGQELKIPLN